MSKEAKRQTNQTDRRWHRIENTALIEKTIKLFVVKLNGIGNQEGISGVLNVKEM